jgi:Ca2+-binding EF-hand superfamily protein
MKTPHLLVLTCLLASSAVAWAGDLAKKIDKIDTDNDGKISRSEYDACATRMFSEADADQDGALTLAEIETAAKDAPRGGNKRDDMGRSHWLGKDKFKECDTDGDGRISVAESNAARDRIFEKLDTDKDGSLSEAEVEAAHKMKKEKQEKHD